jgi:adenylate kinase
MKSILSIALLVSSANAFFTQPSAAPPPPYQAGEAAAVRRHASSASVIASGASKNKRKAESRTRWSESRGHGAVAAAGAAAASASESESAPPAAPPASSSSTTAVGGGGRAPPPRLIIAGAPASGKGTQCELIKAKYGVVHLSTGDMLRAAVSAGTDVGMRARDYMDSGRLVPDEVIIGVVSSSGPTCRWICRGVLLGLSFLLRSLFIRVP